jgi:hypothetical protein
VTLDENETVGEQKVLVPGGFDEARKTDAGVCGAYGEFTLES